jgi:AraC-like DNA-binding protein
MQEPVYRALAESRIVQDYQAAFEGLTGINVSLVSINQETPGSSFPGKPNPICAQVAKSVSTCKLCWEGKIGAQPQSGKKSATRPPDCLVDRKVALVPVSVGGKHVATLLARCATGGKPEKVEFSSLVRMVVDYGVNVDLLDLREEYLHAKVLPEKKFSSVVRLLTVFARHLSEFGSHWMLEQQSRDPLSVAQAKEFVQSNSTGEITLQQAANHVHLSAGHFCSTFRKHTGITFTEYVSRVRVEKAKTLLADATRRITDVAFDSGYESIPHFNRVFKRYAGMSPSQFRVSLRS